MKYALPERIGNPDLLVGREAEFARLHKWIRFIPRRLSKSWAILARKKAGKTAIVQRIFNELWDAGGDVIPFYYEMADRKTWFPDFAEGYFRVFASQYISFRERDADPVRQPLALSAIRAYGQDHGIEALVSKTDSLVDYIERGHHDLAWNTAFQAPHHFAGLYEQSILVILDEFQNINTTIYRDKGCETALDETLAGSYHEYSESKIAPMLVTGSYMGRLTAVIGKYLEGGRLKQWEISPALTKEEGLRTVYKYAEVYEEPITHETAALINELCRSDPFYISCVVQSQYGDKDLSDPARVIETAEYEISNPLAEMNRNWTEYIANGLDRVNDRHAKQMLLFLSRRNDRFFSHRELKKELGLEISEKEIWDKLEIMARADLLEKGTANVRYRGLQDGTLYLIINNAFREEIENFQPDQKQEFRAEAEELKRKNRSLQGRLNYLSGKMLEDLLAADFRNRKRFKPSLYFEGVSPDLDGELNLHDVRTRVKFQRPDGKELEIDIRAESQDGRTLLVECKKTQDEIGARVVEDFWEKVNVAAELNPEQKMTAAIAALGGFSPEALEFCAARGIGTTSRVEFYQNEWSEPPAG